MLKSRSIIRPLAILFILFSLCAVFTLPSLALSIEELGDSLGSLEQELPGLSTIAASILSINSLEDANAFLDGYSMGILLITALIAAVMAFCGYRALRFAILLGGFVAGWSLGTALYAWVHTAGLLASLEPIPAYVPYIIFAACGFFAAFFAMKIIRFGIFMAAAAGTYFFLNSMPSLDAIIDQLITEDIDKKYMLVRLIVALLVGALALLLTRPVLIITTSAAGGMIAAISLMVAIEQTANINLERAIGVILAVSGMLVPFGTSRRRKRARR